ncbi:hypothetical protein [Anaerosporobacter sp.]
MNFDGAVIKEQGITFGIVVVKPHVLNSSDREPLRNKYSIVFGGIPVVLMAQDSRGIPTYHGRKDIVNFLANIHISQIPWKKYTLN